MAWTLLIAIIALTVNLISVGLFVFLSVQSKDRFLRLWTLAWCLQLLPAVAILRLSFMRYTNPPGLYLIAIYGPDIITAALVLVSLHTLLERRAHELWSIAAVTGFLWVVVGFSTSLPFYFTMVPFSLLVSLFFVKAGILLLSRPPSLLPGRGLAGSAFLALGLFELNRPFTSDLEWLQPLFNGLGATLMALAAVGLLLLYFRRIRARVQADQSLYEEIFRTMREGVVVYEIVRDRYGEAVNYAILDMNPGYEHIAGVRRETVLGRTPTSIWDLPTPPFLAIFADVASGGEPVQFEAFFEELGKHLSVSVSSPAPGTFATAVSDITARKEAEGQLARHQDLLEEQVKVRTCELEGANKLLGAQNREIAAINAMQEDLQGCRAPKETWPVLQWVVKQLFPNTSGSLSFVNSDSGTLETAACWGPTPTTEDSFPVESCPALTRGKSVLLSEEDSGVVCGHRSRDPEKPCLCLPLLAHGQSLGSLFIQFDAFDVSDSERVLKWRRLAVNVVEQFTMAYANLQLRDRLHHQSVRDQLTGLFNRRYMEESLEREILRADRHDLPLGIIMLDIDHFKKVNDGHGHDIGDRVLEALGAMLPNLIRGEDIACRYGGEEFILIMPGASVEDTLRRAEEIRRLIRTRISVPLPDGKDLHITSSFGVAVHPLHGAGADGILKAADQALYRSKRDGRDRVTLAEE
ncbi:MAG: sensor domain-containing diguanylate cyclase [Pseudomonadota bacterium]